ncbi:MAG: rubredoxin-like domain-containing protein [Candidatus Hydrothermarchaeota archaeon]
MASWRCTSCGYSYEGKTALEVCPSCSSKCTFLNKSVDCRENPEECQRP